MWTRGRGSKNLKVLLTSYLEAPYCEAGASLSNASVNRRMTTEKIALRCKASAPRIHSCVRLSKPNFKLKDT